MQNKKEKYIRPGILQMAEIELERSFLEGSLVPDIEAVEIEGQQTGGFFDMESDAGNTFNHEWGK